MASQYPGTYSIVPNNSVAPLIIFENFSLPTRLIWSYTLIKVQIIILPTCLLSIILNFVLSNFNAFTVKLGNKERFDKELIGVKEPFPKTNLPFTS